jgi:hypothetical protein
MTPPKMTRKQRAAIAKIQAASSLSQPRVISDFLTDDQARFKACLWAILLTFGYGVVNDLIFRRPVKQISIEAILVCIGTFTIQVVRFYVGFAGLTLRRGLSDRLWSDLQRVERQRFARVIGGLSLTLVLVLSVGPAAAVEPAIAVWMLKRTNAGLIPGLDSGLKDTTPEDRFRKVSRQIEQAIRERMPTDPKGVSAAKESLANIVENIRLPEAVSDAAKLELAYLQSYETLSRIATTDPQALNQISSAYTPGTPMVIGAGVDKTTIMLAPSAPAFMILGPNPIFFSGFTVASAGHTPGTPVPEFAGARGISTTRVIFNDIKIEGLAQDIGNLTWTNVTFQGCLIRYHGQRVLMGNVRFINCTFESSLNGQRVLNYLSTHQGDSVNVYVP